jgi:hypothetical protein
MKEQPLLKDSEHSGEPKAVDHKSASQTQQSDTLAFSILYFQNKMILQRQPGLSRFMENSKQRGKKGL